MAEVKYVFYQYEPSLVAATIFVVLFTITTAIHVFQLARKRTWYFIPFVIGGICEAPLPLHRDILYSNPFIYS